MTRWSSTPRRCASARRRRKRSCGALRATMCSTPPRGLNRSAVGKTQVSFTSRRPQQLAPSTLTSLLACTNTLRRAILRHGYVWRQPRSDSSLRGRPALFPERAPCPSIQSTWIKAKAVPVAASSSEIASARPTGPELRPRSFTALRVQHSSERTPEPTLTTERWFLSVCYPKAMIQRMDPALMTLAHDGTKSYGDRFDLVHRREAGAPNAIWQADHS